MKRQLVTSTALAVTFAGAVTARAATFTVDRLDDSATAVDCQDLVPNDCSLRGAIIKANGLSGANAIVLPAGTYTLTIAGQNEDAAATGDLDIRNDLTITGAGAASTVIDGGGLDRVFEVLPPGFIPIAVTIRDLTIRNGDCTASAGPGGGVLNGRLSNVAPTLTLVRVVVRNNASGVPGQGYGGGGIFNLHGSLTVVDSTITGNTTVGSGGGINTFGCSSGATVTGSIVSNNTAGSTGGGVNALCGLLIMTNSTISNNTAVGGGGMTFTGGGAGTLTLADSTVSNNTAQGGGGGLVLRGQADVARSTISGNVAGIGTGFSYPDGGGIVLDSLGGLLNLTNSTVSGNAATRDGGGIAIDVGEGHPNTVNLNNVTITNNAAGSAGGGVFGFFLVDQSDVFNVRNTIIAGNTGPSALGPDCAAPLTSFGHNLIQNPTGCLVSGDTTGSVVGLDPRLDSLRANGGPTLTHGLLIGSPAIDAGDNASCSATDQRGVARPVGAACDIGAFEGTLDRLTILTESPLFNQLGLFSSDPLEATGGSPPYSWSVIDGALPAGMNLSTGGILSGTPTQIGSFAFTVRVTDGASATAAKAFVKEVSATTPPQIRVNKFGTAAVPGREITYFILVRNVGPLAVTGPQSVEFLQPFQTFISANPVPLSVEDDTISWDLPPLAPGAFSVLSYKVSLDPVTPLGLGIRGTDCSAAIIKTLKDDAKQCRNLCKEGGTLEIFGHTISVPGCDKTQLPWLCQVACWSENCQDGLFADAASLAGECGSFLELSAGPFDPNEKGAIAHTFIQPDQTLVYPIHFENIGSIEALNVFVTDVLDPNLDAATVQILTPGGTFDPATRTVRWNLLGINLLPGKSDNVLVAVKPLPGLPSGTEIRNTAAIQFEVFQSMTTNEVLNIVDTTPPTCVMAPLPATTGMTSFPISWSGTDAIGEIASYTILVSVDGGSFTPFLSKTTKTGAAVAGQAGRTYGFICVATDTARNMEVQSLVAEAVTMVAQNAIVPPAIAKSFGTASIPLNGSTSLGFTISNPNASTALTGVAFTDALPSGLVVATPNGLTGSCGGGTITATAGSGGVSLTGATLAASGSCAFSVSVTASSLGTKNNVTGAVTSVEGGSGGAASATLSVVAPGSAMLLYPLTPCRLLDTRNAAGPLGAPPLAPSGSPDRAFAITGVCGIPSDAQAVSVNVTVTNVQASGTLLLYRGDGSPTTASTISFRPGVTRANNTQTQLALDGSGTFRVQNSSAGTLDFIVDVNGFYR